MKYSIRDGGCDFSVKLDGVGGQDLLLAVSKIVPGIFVHWGTNMQVAINDVEDLKKIRDAISSALKLQGKE